VSHIVLSLEELIEKGACKPGLGVYKQLAGDTGELRIPLEAMAWLYTDPRTKEYAIWAREKGILPGVFAPRAKWARLDLSFAYLVSADLSNADLWSANLNYADLRGANLRGASLRGADLYQAKLRGASLQDADLAGAHLAGADLRGADLRDALMGGTFLRGASLRGANLRGADLSDAILLGADLDSANRSQRERTIDGWVVRDGLLARRT